MSVPPRLLVQTQTINQRHTIEMLPFPLLIQVPYSRLVLLAHEDSQDLPSVLIH